MIKVYITVKSIGKKKNHLERKEWELMETPHTLRALITDIVAHNVKRFNERQTDIPLVPYLTQSEVELQGAVGKVGFGALYNENKASADEAICTAVVAFEDGLYRVFINDNEVEQLDSPLTVREGDDVAFIRFTMLAGRMW